MNIKEIIECFRKVSFNCGTPALVNDFILLCLEQNLPLYSNKIENIDNNDIISVNIRNEKFESNTKRLIKATKDNIQLLIKEDTTQVGIYPYSEHMYFLYTYSQESIDKWDKWTKEQYTILDIKDLLRDIKISNVLN
jgi:hypothetical protein